jgi:hypothetical protein
MVCCLRGIGPHGSSMVEVGFVRRWVLGALGNPNPARRDAGQGCGPAGPAKEAANLVDAVAAGPAA